MTARQELSSQGVGPASPDNSDTPGSTMSRLAGRGPCSEAAELQATHSSGADEGPEQSEIEGASSLSHGQAVERPELWLGEQESTHYWTGTTGRVASLACSDWSEERDVGRSRLDRVEGCGDNCEPGRTGSRTRS